VLRGDERILAVYPSSLASERGGCLPIHARNCAVVGGSGGGGGGRGRGGSKTQPSHHFGFSPLISSQMYLMDVSRCESELDSKPFIQCHLPRASTAAASPIAAKASYFVIPRLTCCIPSTQIARCTAALRCLASASTLVCWRKTCSSE
jgi:hypothetical protein